MNTRFLNALNGISSECPPIWLMRQAGRYLPEYLELRKKYSFLEMCHQPELAAEVTLLPFKRFDFDAAILFSDILILLEALGFQLRFVDATGPIIDNPLSKKEEVDQIKIPDVKEALSFIEKEIHLLKSQLKVPLIGFCGAPFTLASYLIEGKTSRDFTKTKKWMLREPETFHLLLEKISKCTIDYLHLQIDAGVDAIQIFDSWANALSYDQFQEFSSPYIRKIIELIAGRNIPTIVFCKGTAGFISSLIHTGAEAISVDWTCSLGEMRKSVPQHVTLQGNLDPHVLFASHSAIRESVYKILKQVDRRSRYIFNLGHGILPDTPLDAVNVLLDCVRALPMPSS